MATQDKLYIVDDLATLPDDGKLHELHNGVLSEVVGSKFRQARLAVWIAHLLTEHIEKNKLKGSVSSTEGVYILSKYNTRIPDVGYISTSEAQQVGKQSFVKGTPDLAVEISEEKSPKQMLDRAGGYLNAGTKLVWFLYPEIQKADVYRISGEQFTVEQGTELEGYDVLAGLKLPLKTLFSPFSV